MVRFGHSYQKVNSWCFFYSSTMLFFLFIFLKLISIFIKALYQFIVLSFASYHPFSKNSSTFKATVSCISLYISRKYTCILTSIVDIAYIFHILQLKSLISLHHHNHHPSLSVSSSSQYTHI